jgi:flagellin-like hook-associated protein FlgL
MAISVLTNIQGIIGGEDLRRVTIELGGVMKRLQTGLRVNSAADDVGALIQSHVLTRTISTLEVAIQQLETTDSTLLHIERSIGVMGQEDQGIQGLLTRIRNAVTQATDPTANKSALQEAINQWYLEIRNLVRTTIFKQTQLLRGGMGNKIIAPASILITNLEGSTRDFLSVGNIDVSGINLAGYASGALADTTVPNLVCVRARVGAAAVPGVMFTYSVALNQIAVIAITMNGGVVSADLQIGGNSVFTESLRVTFTGAQVLDFKNLGLRIFMDNGRFGQAATIDAVITIRREQPKVFRGVDAGSEADYFRFEIPNLEPENLLGTSSLGGGTLFTFNIETEDPARALQMIDMASKYLDKVKNQIGVTLNLVRAAKDQAHDQRLQAQIQRAAIMETKFDEDAVRLTALQVIQQSATAMIAISRLTPQLVLQLFGR